MDKFKMTKMDSLRYLLGIEIDMLPGKLLAFRQRKYLATVIEKFGSPDMYPADTPMSTTFDTKEEPQEPEATDDKSYHNLVGALQYLVRSTRPDIVYAVRTLAKYASCHTKAHWTLVMR